jgi:hypothetical protein
MQQSSLLMVRGIACSHGNRDAPDFHPNVRQRFRQQQTLSDNRDRHHLGQH